VIVPPSTPTLVVGLGNALLSDDGAGLRVLDLLRHRIGLDANADQIGQLVLQYDVHGGLRLMERLVGFQCAIVVDAICTGAPAGTLFELAPTDVPTAHSASAHDATLATALAFGRTAGAVLPEDSAIRLIAIEAADIRTFCEHCTPAVQACIPRAVDLTLQRLATAPKWGPPIGQSQSTSRKVP